LSDSQFQIAEQGLLSAISDHRRERRIRVDLAIYSCEDRFAAVHGKGY
jgi:hypothetical protein